MASFSPAAFDTNAFSVGAWDFAGAPPQPTPPPPEYGSGGAMGWNSARKHIEAKRERKRRQDEDILTIVRFLAKWINDNHLL